MNTNNIIKIVLNSLGNTLQSFLHKSIDTVNNGFTLFNKVIDEKIENENKKEIKKDEETIKDVCDKGTMDDLLDLKKNVKILMLLIIFTVSGCTSTEIEISTTKSWEGHYLNEKNFYEATNNIKLEKGESIWVLSNRSLKRVLVQKQER